MEFHVYKIADYKFCSTNFIKRLLKFSCKTETYDYKFNESEEHMSKIIPISQRCTKEWFYLTNACREIAEILPTLNGFLLHSATFDVAGIGVALSALSGTGKTTHLANWWMYLNGTEDMPECFKASMTKNQIRIENEGNNTPSLTIVNGDKPIVRFFDEEFCKEKGLEIPEGTEFGVPYAYGTPWCGKENLGCNMRTKLKHICFIERSESNFVTKIDKNEAVNRIMKQVYMPKDPIALANTLKLVDRLINSCELWIIHCNMEPESAKIAYDAIFNNE